MNAQNFYGRPPNGLRKRLTFSSTDFRRYEPFETEKKPVIKQMMSILYRDLGKFGYHLMVKAYTDNNMLTVTRKLYILEDIQDLDILKDYLKEKIVFGHSLYIDTITDSDNCLLAALYISFNEKKETQCLTYFLNNVIPRSTSTANEWISGLFIGDKSIEESFELSKYDDRIQGGIIEIKSTFEIPFEITDEEKKKITVGIYVGYGARVVLKSEKITVNELSAEQKTVYDKKQVSGSANEHQLMCILLQGGAFVWVETELEVRTHDNSLRNSPKPIKDLLASKQIDSNIVPIIELSRVSDCNDWGIQIKPVIEGIYSTRRVCIEAPKEWDGMLTIREWNKFNIETYFYRNNIEPQWTKQDYSGRDFLEALSKKPVVYRNVSLNIWLNKRRNFYKSEDFSRIRLSLMKTLVKEKKFYLYSRRFRSGNQLIASLKEMDNSHECHSSTGPVYVTNDEESANHLAFTLAQNRRYGTHLFVFNNGIEDIFQLKAFICGKGDQTFNLRSFTLNAFLPQPSDNDIWVKGLLIGGIDVVRKQIVKSSKKRTHAKYWPKSSKSFDNKNIPQIYKNWEHSMEILSSYRIPVEKKCLPFSGQIIGIYIESGTRCVAINGAIDKDMYKREFDKYQVFESRKSNPILLQSKAFLWIEGSVEFNLLEDINICFQPLEYSLIEELIREQRIVGETDGIESSGDLVGKVLFLKQPNDKDIVWSLEVSPLMFPIYESRVIYINIPIGGQIEVKNWDNAFRDIISRDHLSQPKWASQALGQIVNEDQKVEPTIPLSKWIDRDLRPRIYEFLQTCQKIGILITIPIHYRRNANKTMAQLKNNNSKLVRNYSNLFFIYEHNKEKNILWFVIKYKLLFQDRFGLMKFYISKRTVFENLFKKTFYQQLV
jgi:hypothetical protein